MRRRGARRWLARAILAGALGLLVSSPFVWRRVMPGALFLLRVADKTAQAERAGLALLERNHQVPAPQGPMRARSYVPVEGHRRTVVLIHGIHHRGIDEERLVPFARKLAGLGFAVVTPQIADLARYEIDPRAVDDIERSVLWTLDRSGLVRPVPGDGKVGLIGISFAGGLSVSAAGRPAVRDRIAFACSLGGHAELERVMGYLATGKLQGAAVEPPHVYGVAVLLGMFAHRVVEASQVEPLRECVREFLRTGKDAARGLAARLDPQARELATLCLERDVARLGALLAPHVLATRGPDCLSPLRSPPPACPVYLLHGRKDNLIPPFESESLARRLGPTTPTEVLVSGLLDHVDLDLQSWPAIWEMIGFWSRLLRQ